MAPFSLELLPLFFIVNSLKLFYVSIHCLPHCFTLLCLPAVHHEDGANRAAADHDERNYTSRRSSRRHAIVRVRHRQGAATNEERAAGPVSDLASITVVEAPLRMGARNARPETFDLTWRSRSREPAILLPASGTPKRRGLSAAPLHSYVLA